MVKIYVDNRVRISRRELTEQQERAVQKEFEHKNPMFAKKRAMGYNPWASEQPVIGTWLVDDDFISVPRGGLRRAQRILKHFGHRFDVTDRRFQGKPLSPNVRGLLELRPYQRRATQAAFNSENCLISSSTGSGKTSMIIAMIPMVGVWTLVIVDSNAIALEWVERAKNELDLKGNEIGFIGKGRFDIKPISVAMNQSLNAIKNEKKWQEIIRSFGMVACDEVHVFGASTFQTSIDRFPARYRIGVSDDYRRPDGKHFLIEDMFGGVAYKVGDEELIEAGAIDNVRILVKETQFKAPWYRIPSGAPGKYNRLLEEISRDTARNTLIGNIAQQEVEAGHQMMIITERDEHTDTLLAICRGRGIPCGKMVSGTATFEKVASEIKSGLLKVGIGTQKSLGKGVNIPSLSRGINAGLVPKSLQPWRQRRGRFCRPTGDSAYWVLWDKQPLGNKPLRSLIEWNTDVLVDTSKGMIDAKQFLKRPFSK